MDKLIGTIFLIVAGCGLAIIVWLIASPSVCQASRNRMYEARCPDEGAATGLPFKIAKISGWSECYLRCPKSWVPSDSFHGCPP
jgi:hypothetical protein